MTESFDVIPAPCLTCPVRMVGDYEQQAAAEIEERGRARIRTRIALFLCRQNLLSTQGAVAKIEAYRTGNYTMAYECQAPARSAAAYLINSNSNVCEAIIPNQ